MTSIRPPGLSIAGPWRRRVARLSISRFTAIRSAWKVRVAGCAPPRRCAPRALSTIARNSPVVAIGPRRRASTIIRAIRRAALLAVGIDDAREFLGALFIYNVFRLQRLPVVHPHVEGTVEPKRKPPLRIVERVT